MSNAPAPGPNDIVELPVPDDWTKLFESRYLHAADLNDADQLVTIEKVKFEELADPKRKGQRKRMGSLVFVGKRKALGLNRTNAACLKEMFGPKVAAWAGKRIVLFPTTVRMPRPGSREMVDEPCIRVRGSPDIAADITFELHLPQRAPQQVALKKTGGAK